MSYYNYFTFNFKSESDSYTIEDINSIKESIKKEIEKSSYPEWLVTEILLDDMDCVNLNNGNITIGNESENITQSYWEEYGMILSIVIKALRELKIKIIIPGHEDQPKWEVEGGASGDYTVRYELYLENPSSMESDWKEGDDDDEAVYIDENGEED